MDEHPLSEYRELLGELTDDQIAEMSDRPLVEVAAYRAAVEGEADDGIDPDDDAEAGSVAVELELEPTEAQIDAAVEAVATEAVASVAPSDVDVVREAATRIAVDPEAEPHVARAAEALRAKLAPKPDPAPPSVRVRRRVPRNLRVRWHDGKERRLSRFDIYSGKDAVHLWTHARQYVEPYPPRKG